MFQVIWFGSMPKCLDHFGSHPLVLLPRVQLPSPWVPNTLQSHVNWAHHSSPILFGMTTYMYRTCIVCIHIHTVVLISYPIQKHNTYFILFLNSPLFCSTSSCKQSQSIETLRMAVSSPYHHVLQLTSGSWGQVGAWTTWKPRPRRRPKRAGETAKISGFRPDVKIGAGNGWKPLEELNIEDMEDDSLSFHIRGIYRSWLELIIFDERLCVRWSFVWWEMNEHCAFIALSLLFVVFLTKQGKLHFNSLFVILYYIVVSGFPVSWLIGLFEAVSLRVIIYLYGLLYIYIIRSQG